MAIKQTTIQQLVVNDLGNEIEVSGRYKGTLFTQKLLKTTETGLLFFDDVAGNFYIVPCDPIILECSLITNFGVPVPQAK